MIVACQPGKFDSRCAAVPYGESFETFHTDNHTSACSVARLRKTQAGSLDDSLQNIARLESAAEGGGKKAAASPEQSEGREQLQVTSRYK